MLKAKIAALMQSTRELRLKHTPSLTLPPTTQVLAHEPMPSVPVARSRAAAHDPPAHAACRSPTLGQAATDEQEKAEEAAVRRLAWAAAQSAGWPPQARVSCVELWAGIGARVKEGQLFNSPRNPRSAWKWKVLTHRCSRRSTCGERHLAVGVCRGLDTSSLALLACKVPGMARCMQGACP